MAADILNHNDLSEGGMNPGLRVLWEEERERRAQLGLDTDLEPPHSPPRPAAAELPSESEQFWLERLRQVIAERSAEESGARRRSGDSRDPDSTLNIGKTEESGRGGGWPRVYPAESSEQEELSLPQATQLEEHVGTLSQTGLGSASFLESSLSLGGEQEEEADLTIVDEDLATQVRKRQEKLELFGAGKFATRGPGAG